LEIKAAAILVLSLLPVLVIIGIRQIFPTTPALLLALVGTSATLLKVFPFHAIGEGGISRVAGAIVGIPWVFRFLSKKATPWDAASFASI
jgi:hypothetical protein